MNLHTPSLLNVMKVDVAHVRNACSSLLTPKFQHNLKASGLSAEVRGGGCNGRTLHSLQILDCCA